MYEKNYETLCQVVADKKVIRHVSKHRLPDGKFDLDGNMKIWNDALVLFDLIPLWEDDTPNYDKEKTPLQPEPSIIFVPARRKESDDAKKSTIIVAHGGGFQSRTGCEGMNVAKYFVDQGFNAAILTYRLQPYTRFDAIADMQRAIRLLRSRQQELNITDKITVMGFSAGAMLSGNCATHYDNGNPDAEDVIERFGCRPDACVMGYGAFATMAFPGPFFRSPFKDPDKKDKLYLSPENNLTMDCPPFFIWQTNSDDPRNAFTLGSRLTEVGIPFELHCFPDGVHGMALCDGENDLSMRDEHLMHWAELCTEWLHRQGV